MARIFDALAGTLPKSGRLYGLLRGGQAAKQPATAIGSPINRGQQAAPRLDMASALARLQPTGGLAPVRPAPMQAPQIPTRAQPVEAPQDITNPIPVRLPGTSPFLEGLNDPRLLATIGNYFPPAAAPLALPPAPAEQLPVSAPVIDPEELQRVIANFLANYLPRATGINPAAVPLGNLPTNTGTL